MKKKIVIGILLTSMISVLTACGDASSSSSESASSSSSIEASSSASSSSSSTDTSSTQNSSTDKVDENSTEDLKAISENKAEGETYKGNGYTITYPSKWTKLDKSSNAMVDFAIAIKDANAKSGQSINVVLEDVSAQGKDFTLDDYVKAAIKQFDSLPNAKASYKGKCLINEYEAAYVSSTITQGEISTKNDQYIILNNGKAYVLTYGSITEDGYENMKKEASAIINSFTFTK